MGPDDTQVEEDDEEEPELERSICIGVSWSCELGLRGDPENVAPYRG